MTKPTRRLFFHLLGLQACLAGRTTKRQSLPKPRWSIKLPWLRHAVWNPALLGFLHPRQIQELSPSHYHVSLLSLAPNLVPGCARQSPAL